MTGWTYAGDKIARSQLGPREIRIIRSLYATGEYTLKVLAQRFKVSTVTIRKVVDSS